MDTHQFILLNCLSTILLGFLYFARILFIYFFLLHTLGEGNIAILSSIFTASPAAGPPQSFEDPMAYPAIKGLAQYFNTTFINFTKYCGSDNRDYIYMTLPAYGDIIHPTVFKETKLVNVEDESKVR